MSSILDVLREEYSNIDSNRRGIDQEQRGVLAAMHDKLTNAEVAQRSPSRAGFLGAAANFLTPKGSIAGYIEGKQQQEALRDKAAIGAMPEMNNYLTESGKQLSSLQEEVMKRMSSREGDAANRYYSVGTAADGLIAFDKQTGKTDLITIPARFSQQLVDSTQKWTDILAKEGGDPATIQGEAHKRAMFEIGSMMGIHPFGNAVQQGFKSPVGIPGSTPAMERPAVTPAEEVASAMGTEPGAVAPIGTAPMSGKPVEAAINDLVSREKVLAQQLKMGKIDKPTYDQRKLVLAEEYRRIAPEGSGFHPRDIIPPDQPVSGSVVGQPPAASGMKILTPQQRAAQQELGQLHAKENSADREAYSSMQRLEESRAVMSDIINSGVHTSSPMHELLSEAGGFMSLIDPHSKLAKMAGNDQMYYANLMNLVRDKIKALGAGTAVSNLDLIVTQKSVGDLRNTADGNKKLLAVMELQNQTMMAKLGAKNSYFDTGKTYDGWKGNSSATHILRRSPSTGDYWVQSREDWVAEQVKAGTVRNDKEADKFFDKEARAATKRMIKGTSLDPDYYKK